VILLKALETRKKFLEKAKKQTQEALSRKDALIIQAVRSLDDFDDVKALLQQRIAEWFKINFPDLRANDELIARIAAEFGGKENFSEKKLAEIVGEPKAEAIMRVKGESFGAAFDKADSHAMQTLGKQIVGLMEARKETQEYVTSLVEKELKNVAYLTDPILAARLLSLAGSIENLAEMPASTIQVIGAENSLFKHLRQHTAPPKHGVIFQHPAINGAPLEQRGRIARALAAKISIAARADYYTGNFIAEKLKEQFEKRLTQVHEAPIKPRKPSMIRNDFRDRERRPDHGGGFSEKRPPFRPRGEGDFRPRREGDFRERDRRPNFSEGRPPFKPRGEGNFRPRDSGDFRDRERRPTQGGFPERRPNFSEGRPPFKPRDQGVQPRREGDFRPRPKPEFRQEQGDPRPSGESKPSGGFRPKWSGGNKGKGKFRKNRH